MAVTFPRGFSDAFSDLRHKDTSKPLPTATKMLKKQTHALIAAFRVVLHDLLGTVVITNTHTHTQ